MRFVICLKILECREIANFGGKHRGADLLCQRIFLEIMTCHTRKRVVWPEVNSVMFSAEPYQFEPTYPPGEEPVVSVPQWTDNKLWCISKSRGECSKIRISYKRVRGLYGENIGPPGLGNTDRAASVYSLQFTELLVQSVLLWYGRSNFENSNSPMFRLAASEVLSQQQSKYLHIKSTDKSLRVTEAHRSSLH